ncbi:DASH complex, subunit Spc19 [Ascosphaera apis ARSEF 7405]|uniref:DASH complex subunit SPC19 n=1 Tax=Ascosphaera apis ARSEF 7405 TaxID=392613 RepID=A0A167V0I8_9EURO|nr:DASH complex, subunit Spc19 [Ascosphaera apis ARSEF 7405]
MAGSLAASVSSLQSSLQLLDSSIAILDEGVSDFPRMAKVLQTRRHFELLPEPTLHDAQKAIMDEIAPSIAHLLNITENHIEKMARREEALRAKSKLQQGRLSHDTGPTYQQRQLVKQKATIAADPGKIAELRRLQQKRERLQYTVERLELQRKQKERQFRKSMAFQ